MGTFLRGLLVLLLAAVAVAFPIWLVMVGLGILHDLHSEVPAFGFVTVLWAVIITGVFGAAWNGNNFWESRK